MFLVCLTGGGTFSATTVGTGTVVVDPQLFLFDTGGLGVYGNDDSTMDLQSTLPAGTTYTPAVAGTYYLAISSFANRPFSAAGPIFTNFDFAGGELVLLPGPPGGGSPVSGWDGNGSFTGSYRIVLTGAEPCAVTPQTKEDCKNGGWRNFTDDAGQPFKNQGQCVSFVIHASKAA